MCRNSKNGAKRIVALFSVFALLVFPCCARASWGGLFGVSEPTVQSAVGQQDLPKVSSEDSLQVGSMNPSETANQSNYQELLITSTELEMESIALSNELTTILSSLESLKKELETYQQTDKISELQYEELVTTLSAVTDKTAELETYANKLESDNVSKDVKIAELKQKVFRPFVKLNATFDFKTLVPTLGAGASVGLIAKNLMFEVGANYRIGDIKTFDFGDTFNLDRLSVSVGVGWVF